MDWLVGFIIFGASLYSTFYLTRKFIRRFHAGGHVVKDMYKKGTPNVPTMGGIALIGGIMMSLIIAQLLLPAEMIERLLIFYFVVFIYGIFGLLDDLIAIKSRFKRVYIPFFLALPIGLLNIDTNISIFSHVIEIGWMAPLLFAPIYVMVVSNLINMHAGFNGLSGGLSTILVFFVGLKAYLKYDGDILMFMLPLFGALLAFMWFNRYPSRIFLGNSGTMMLGAGVGGLIVLYNIEIFGVIILIPHIINFIMWIYWLANMHIYPHIKFATVREDGTIEPPNKLTMKYFVTAVFRVNEKKATNILFLITCLFCFAGLLFTN